MKMKLTILLTFVVFSFVVGTKVIALNIPDVSTDNGYIFTASRNVDNGTAYVADINHPDFPGFPVGPLDPDNLPAWASRIKSAGSMPQADINGDNISDELEDTWGIWHMYQITNGYFKPDGTVEAVLPGYYDNSAGLQDTWLVGIFWGGNDTDVWFDVPSGVQAASFAVEAENVHFELWAVEKSTLDSAAISFGELMPFNITDRTVVNRYNGWLDAITIAGGQKLLSGTSTYFRFDGAVYDEGKFDGESRMWFDVDEADASGSWNPLWGGNPPTAFVDPDGNPADMYMSWDLEIGTTWDTISRDFGGAYATETEELECRVTGGGVDEYTGLWDGTLAKAQDEVDDGTNQYTFGGQAGAPTGCQPQPWGNWTHHQKKGPAGSFTFHAGTASAPPGTEIDWIACADPGWCIQARPAPAKQINFAGVGTFKNIRKSPLATGPDKVVPGETFHWFEVHIEDLGEPGKGGKVDPPAPQCPPEGSEGDLADCECPDYYRITIYKAFDPAGDPDQANVIYEVYGYIKGGNLQIHPPLPCK